MTSREKGTSISEFLYVLHNYCHTEDKLIIFLLNLTAEYILLQSFL